MIISWFIGYIDIDREGQKLDINATDTEEPTNGSGDGALGESASIEDLTKNAKGEAIDAYFKSKKYIKHFSMIM